MSTTATVAASLMGDDGQNYESDEGESLDGICERLGATAEHGGSDGQQTRHLFDDGSAIVDCDGQGWDIEGDTPWSWEGA